MPPKTLTEKVEELKQVTVEQDRRLTAAERDIAELRRQLDAEAATRRAEIAEFRRLLEAETAARQAETAARLAERQAFEVRIAVLERLVAELRTAREEVVRRAWALLGPLVGAAAGAIVTYLVRR